MLYVCDKFGIMEAFVGGTSRRFAGGARSAGGWRTARGERSSRRRCLTEIDNTYKCSCDADEYFLNVIRRFALRRMLHVRPVAFDIVVMASTCIVVCCFALSVGDVADMLRTALLVQSTV